MPGATQMLKGKVRDISGLSVKTEQQGQYASNNECSSLPWLDQQHKFQKCLTLLYQISKITKYKQPFMLYQTPIHAVPKSAQT
jgi:hypothetical protein